MLINACLPAHKHTCTEIHDNSFMRMQKMQGIKAFSFAHKQNKGHQSTKKPADLLDKLTYKNHDTIVTAISIYVAFKYLTQIPIEKRVQLDDAEGGVRQVIIPSQL